MDKLLIKYRFQGIPYIVADGKGEFYQLPHVANKQQVIQEIEPYIEQWHY